jgi:hypothetical protein
VTAPLVFQLLSCRIEVRAESPAVRESLRYLVQDASQSVPVTRHVVYEVSFDGEACTIVEDGRRVASDLAPLDVMPFLYPRTHVLAIREAGSPTRLHTGCATTPNGKRFLMAGASNAGKTTVLTRMLLDGFPAHADDMCLLQGTTVTPFPRRFHIREPSLALLPELAAVAPRLPALDAGHGVQVYAFSPRDVGRDWEISPGPVAAVFYLEANHGGQTRLHPSTKVEMARRLVADCRPGDAGGKWLGDVCRMLDSAECFVLRLGEPKSAASAVVESLQR